MQLPLITIDNVNEFTEKVLKDVHSWRKEMIHYIKDNNPELNTAIIEIVQKGGFDPKAVATGAYLAYKLLEKEAENEPQFDLDDDE